MSYELIIYIALFIISNIATLIISLKGGMRKLAKAMQMLLRIELRLIYKRCVRKGYATHLDKVDFMSIYEIYHSLGKNGVMDSYKNDILAMKEEKE